MLKYCYKCNKLQEEVRVYYNQPTNSSSLSKVIWTGFLKSIQVYPSCHLRNYTNLKKGILYNVQALINK